MTQLSQGHLSLLRDEEKHAGAELGQVQLQLELGFTLFKFFLHYIDD